MKKKKKKTHPKIFSVALKPKKKKSILDHHIKCAKEKPCRALQETFTIHHPSTMKQIINRRKTASPFTTCPRTTNDPSHNQSHSKVKTVSYTPTSTSIANFQFRPCPSRTPKKKKKNRSLSVETE